MTAEAKSGDGILIQQLLSREKHCEAESETTTTYLWSTKWLSIFIFIFSPFIS